MSEAQFAVPVACAVCGATSLVNFPVAVLAVASARWSGMRLHAPCHDLVWDSTEAELRAIVDYLGSEWLERHRPTR